MTYDEFRKMSEGDLARLGADEIAYIRPIVVDRQTQFMLLAGDGRQLGVAPDYQTAIAAALEHDFQPVSVH